MSNVWEGSKEVIFWEGADKVLRYLEEIVYVFMSLQPTFSVRHNKLATHLSATPFGAVLLVFL